MLCGKSKWEVYRCEFANGRRQWCAMTRADYWSDRYFDSHAEAMAYADERARTLEVIVPRGLSVEDGTVQLNDHGGIWAEIESHNRSVKTSIGYWSVKDCLEEHGAALVVLARGLREEE